MSASSGPCPRRANGWAPPFLIALVLAGGAFVVYWLTSAPSVLFGDSGEFQFVPYILGIAHPTGYPLYVLLGYVWSHLLIAGDVAYRMNLFSAFWGALTVGSVFLLLERCLRMAVPDISRPARRVAGVAAAATFGVGITFWQQAVVAEVYTLHTFFVTLVLLLVLNLADNGFRKRDALVLVTVYGLSLTHHRTMLLLLPGLVGFLWLRWRRTDKTGQQGSGWSWSMVVWLGLGLVLPGLLYLYLPLQAPHVPYAFLELSGTQTLTLYENTWGGFWRHVLATVFSGSLAVSSVTTAAGVNWLQRLSLVFDLTRQQFGWVGLALAGIGMVRLVLSRRWALLVLLGVGYGLNVAFNLVYLIGDIEVLFLPSYLFVCCCIGLGALAAAVWLARAGGLILRPGGRVPPDPGHGSSRAVILVALLALILPASLGANHWSRVDRSASHEAEDMWRPILNQNIPYGAVLLSNDRDEMMPLWYFQYVKRERPDLLGLFPQVVTSPGYADLGGLINQALQAQRPVYLIKPMPGLDVKVDLLPDDSIPPLVKVSELDLAASPEHKVDGLLGEEMRLAGYDLAPAQVQPGQVVTVTLFWQPQKNLAADYSSYVHLLDDTGKGVAQSDLRPGGDYYPTSLWRPGEMLRDRHHLVLPGDLAPGVYRLVSGMYLHSDMAPLGQPLDVGMVAIKIPGSVLYELPAGVETPLSIAFGDQVALLGYDRVLDGQELRVTLYWQAEQRMAKSWSVFLHLTDSAGQLAAQQDGQPRYGAYPTSVWDEGEVVEDAHRLPLPAQAELGDHALSLGLYLPATGERLPVLDETGQQVSDSFTLFHLRLSSEGWQLN